MLEHIFLALNRIQPVYDEYSITTGLMDKMNIQSQIMERKLNFADTRRNNVFLSGTTSS